MKIGIINAMAKEHEQIALLLHDKKKINKERFTFIEGEFGVNTVVLMQSGIGKVNAAVGAVELIRHFSLDCIINTGVAGGINNNLKVMDVVVGERVVYHDVDCGPESEFGQIQGLPLYYKADKRLYDWALKVKCDTMIRGGLICSGDQFITDLDQLQDIKQRFPDGLAVDMESGAIAQVCYLYQIPFLSFRIISDVPGSGHHFEQYLNFWDTMAEKSFGVTKSLLAVLPEQL